MLLLKIAIPDDLLERLTLQEIEELEAELGGELEVATNAEDWLPHWLQLRVRLDDVDAVVDAIKAAVRRWGQRVDLRVRRLPRPPWHTDFKTGRSERDISLQDALRILREEIDDGGADTVLLDIAKGAVQRLKTEVIDDR